MFDPQDVHGGECARCGQWFADNEHDLDQHGHCDDCAKDLAIDALDDARAAMADANAARIDARQHYEKALQHVYDVGADLPAQDWLAVAADIVGVRR
jgi:predicted amidophosphoribosyltransferase